MVGFVIPFKEKKNSEDWELDCENLYNTVKSIFNQEDPNFMIFIVYSDLPKINFSNEKIHYIKFPFYYLAAREMTDYETIVKPQFLDVIGERMYDQGKRILYGCFMAKKQGCNFVMSVDADDFVSNRISKFVNKYNSEQFGWFVDSGFVKFKGSRLLIKIKRNMNHFNGSTHIVNCKIIPSVDFESRKLADFTFFSAHGYLKSRIQNIYGETLKPLPFYAIIYLVHDKNWSNLKSIWKKHWIKTIAKYLILGKILTHTIKSEFGIEK